VRTKPCEGVLRLDIGRLEPRPELTIAYDGLAGITTRPMLQDVLEELQRKGPKELDDTLAALRRARSGYLSVYFMDYVSYGIGGGDAAAEFFLSRYLLLHEPERTATSTSALVPEHLCLIRPFGAERLSLRGVSGSSQTVDPAREE
jgi:hypothetical protein